MDNPLVVFLVRIVLLFNNKPIPFSFLIINYIQSKLDRFGLIMGNKAYGFEKAKNKKTSQTQNRNKDKNQKGKYHRQQDAVDDEDEEQKENGSGESDTDSEDEFESDPDDHRED